MQRQLNDLQISLKVKSSKDLNENCMLLDVNLFSHFATEHKDTDKQTHYGIHYTHIIMHATNWKKARTILYAPRVLVSTERALTLPLAPELDTWASRQESRCARRVSFRGSTSPDRAASREWNTARQIRSLCRVSLWCSVQPCCWHWNHSTPSNQLSMSSCTLLEMTI